MHVAIAGGGIAGLTAAIALAMRGFKVDLYERAPVLEEIGAGIQLAPNAFSILERLGVAPNLAGRLSEPEALVVRDARTGAVLTRLPLGECSADALPSPVLHAAPSRPSGRPPRVRPAAAHCLPSLRRGGEGRSRG